MEPKEIDIVSLYEQLVDREIDLIVTLVDLYDLLNTKYSNERELLGYVKFELEGYEVHKVVEETEQAIEDGTLEDKLRVAYTPTINRIPSYRKVDIGLFKLPQRSEPLKLIKIIERMEGKTIVTPGIQKLRDGYSFDHIEDFIYIQNRAYEWEEFPRDDKEKNMVKDIKDNPKKKVDENIILKIESGIREVLCLKLKTTFPQIQEQIFDVKIDKLKNDIKTLQLANQKSQWPWKNILRSKDGPNKEYWGIFVSEKLIKNTKEFVTYCFKSKKRIAAAFATLTAGGGSILLGAEDLLRIVLKFFGIDF